MRFEIKDPMYSKRETKLKEWHKWFAWFPVNVRGKRVWMEKVWRKNGTWPHAIKIYSYDFLENRD